MRHYVGIDLGTTNSAICSYDGVNAPRIWKSPEQNDVTPSAIYIGRRGNRLYGYKAYNRLASDEENTAALFKRYMGTSNRFEFRDAALSLSPEECSAEILKVLFSYLPDEVRNDPETATVITVPAAFNQVKKEATLEAAQMAGIGKVTLMQEPVAAIMSFMRASGHKHDGVFLVYDLGGGTFDVSIAESTGSKVNLLTQDGKEMCGGRDWDRRIFNNVIVPWLRGHFDLPEDFLADENYRKLCHLSVFAAEQAKIELSAKEEAQMQSDDLNCEDLEGEEIYLDVPLSRSILNPLIDDLLDETVEISRRAMKKAGLKATDIERLVFVGGPTKYSYLREKVSAELAIKFDFTVDPMTAVAEGASIFAESIDWTSERHNRKPTNADVNLGTQLSFRYEARTAGEKARVVCHVGTSAALSIEVTSADTGWTSGRFELQDGTMLEIPLSRAGENTFKVAVYDGHGRPVPIPEPKIVITKTLATVGAIPASHSIAVTALDKLGGVARLVFLVRKDEPLPKKGRLVFKAEQTLKASSEHSLNFNLWEGEIEDPCEDNRFVGTYTIPGAALNSGEIIPTGADLICDYEISEAGTITMGASAPCLGTDFEKGNFYSQRGAELDLDDSKVAGEGRELVEHIDHLSRTVDDPRLDKAREKAELAASIDNRYHQDEDVQEADSALHETRTLLAQIKKDHLREIRQMELDECVHAFNQTPARYATPSENAAFNNLVRAAQRHIDRGEPEFKQDLDELWRMGFLVLWRQDWFVIDSFNQIVQKPKDYADTARFEELKRRGLACVEKDDIDGLRSIIGGLYNILKGSSSSKALSKALPINIIRG